MQRKRIWPLAATAILCTNLGWAAESVDLEALRKTIQEGDAFFQQGNYQQASESFLAVWSQVKVPTGAWWAGQTYEKLSDLAKAAQFYTMATLLK